MKILNTYVGAFIAFCFITFQMSCKKEQDIYDLFPIKVTSVDTLGTTKIKWTKIESVDFIEYVVVRSDRDSILSFSALNTSGGATIVGRLGTANQTEFFEPFNSSFRVNRVYYRVFARLKNRTISSANYVLNSDLSVVNASAPNEILQDEFNPNLVYLNASNRGQIALYDLEKDSVLARASIGFTSTRTVLASDKGNNAEIVQAITSSNKIIFRDAKTLDVKFTMNNLNYSVYSLAATQDGFVCIVSDEYNKQFKMVRLSDHTVVSTQSNTIDNYPFYIYGVEALKLPNSNNILFLEGNSSSPSFGRLTYDAQGNFTAAKLIGKLASNSSSSQFNKISAQSNYYFLLSQMYTTPLDVNKPLNVFIQSSYSDFIFKQDESKFYVSRQNFNSSTGGTINALEEYNLPNGKISRTLTTKIIGRTVLYKDKAYIFGDVNNNSSLQTALQKIQL